MDGCNFRGLLGLFVNAVVHDPQDELSDHCCDDEDTKDLMGGVEFPGLDGVSMAQQTLGCQATNSIV